MGENSDKMCIDLEAERKQKIYSEQMPSLCHMLTVRKMESRENYF